MPLANSETSAALTLLSAKAVRERAHRMLAIGLEGNLPNFRIDLSGGVWVPIEDPADEGTGGYGRIEFVAVLPRLFR